MKKQRVMKGILLIGFFLFLSLNFISADNDPVSIQARITEAQGALNQKSFDAASAVGTTFSDSINPYTGALTVTQTDVYIPGRNGMDIQITRSYSSDVFLNINQYQSAVLDCGDKNIVACDPTDPYVFCTTPDQISGNKLDNRGLPTLGHTHHMTKCDQGTNVYSASSSFKRPTALGVGWDINSFNKIKDPTTIVFKDTYGLGKHINYNYVSARGINSLSMVLNNNEEELILPAMYSIPDVDEFQDHSYWSNDVGDGVGKIENFADEITAAQNKHISPQSAYFNSFAAYTSDLSPVFLNYPDINSLTSPGNSLEGGYAAVYYAKNGNKYYFLHHVPFCGKYDDVQGIQRGSCSYTSQLDEQDRIDLFNWAENPYPGLYLTGIKDSFGNMIEYNYYSGSPFVQRVTGPRSGAYVDFHYTDKQGNSIRSNFDLNSRIEYLEFNSPTGEQTLYQMYKYRDVGNGQDMSVYGYTYNTELECLNAREEVDFPTSEACRAKTHVVNGQYVVDYYYLVKLDAIPHLEETWTAKDRSGFQEISGTRYKYEYDLNTRELIKVTLPTGASIEYEYSWAPNIPAYDLLREYTDPTQLQTMTKRVVSVRRVRNTPNQRNCPFKTLPGNVASGLWGNDCAWVYQYKTVPKTIVVDGNSRIYFELETTVHDPFGGKTVYQVYPTTVTTLNYR